MTYNLKQAGGANARLYIYYLQWIVWETNRLLRFLSIYVNEISDWNPRHWMMEHKQGWDLEQVWFCCSFLHLDDNVNVVYSRIEISTFFGKSIIIILLLSLLAYVFLWLVYHHYFPGEGGGGGGHVRVWFRRLTICNIPLGVKTYNHYLYKVSSL